MSENRLVQSGLVVHVDFSDINSYSRRDNDRDIKNLVTRQKIGSINGTYRFLNKEGIFKDEFGIFELAHYSSNVSFTIPKNTIDIQTISFWFNIPNTANNTGRIILESNKTDINMNNTTNGSNLKYFYLNPPDNKTTNGILMNTSSPKWQDKKESNKWLNVTLIMKTKIVSDTDTILTFLRIHLQLLVLIAILVQFLFIIEN